MRLAGVEIYSSDLERSRWFYERVLSLEVSEEDAGHHVKFAVGEAFLCMEKSGSENYPSRDKAVIFLEVDDLAATVSSIGRDRFVTCEPNSGWAVLHDPDRHNVLLLQKVRS
jgi:catechol 2,3-dioxygenase-like lactoylglutathione lyase family enzyme